MTEWPRGSARAWPGRVETVDVAELLTPASVAKGSRIRLKQPKLPEGIWDITVSDPPSYFEMSQKSGGVTNVAGHRVVAAEEGGTRLTLSESGQPRGVVLTPGSGGVEQDGHRERGGHRVSFDGTSPGFTVWRVSRMIRGVCTTGRLSDMIRA